MVDQAQSPVFGPPVSPASQVSITITPAEIILMLGVARPALGPDAMPNGQMGIEWTASFAMSPVAAKNLLDVLERGIPAYIERYGPIPVDPAAKLAEAEYKPTA